MGVILTHDITYNAGGLAVGLVMGITLFVHRIQDAPVDWFQAITDIGQGATDDHAHGVIEIRILHFLFDGNRADIAVFKRLFGMVVQGWFDP